MPQLHNFGSSIILLLDIDGAKKLMRDVQVPDVSTLYGIIRSRMAPEKLRRLTSGDGSFSQGAVEVAYFDVGEAQFVPVTETSWRRRLETGESRHVEVRVVTSPHKSAGGIDTIDRIKDTVDPTLAPPASISDGPGHRTQSLTSLRALVVDYVRTLLLDELRAGNISRIDLVSMCSEAAAKLKAKHNLTDDDMNDEYQSNSANVLEPEDKALLAEIVHRRTKPLGTEQPVTPLATELVRRSTHSTPGERSSDGGEALITPAPALFDHSRAVESIATSADTADHSPRASSRPAASVSYANSPRNSWDKALRPGDHTTSRNKEDGGMPFPHASTLLAMSSPPPGAAVRSEHVNRGTDDGRTNTNYAHADGHPSFVPPSSTFRCVRYATVEPLPPLPHVSQADYLASQSGGLRVHLTVPPSWSPDEDILITAHVLSRSSVTLMWWLAYGPHRVPLNLDDMYCRRCLTTFQVSETALLLTIRRGTLVPGWDYRVHLTATSDISGVSASAQAEFAVAHLGQVPSRYVDTEDKTVRMAVNGMTSRSGARYLRGYQADEDVASRSLNRIGAKTLRRGEHAAYPSGSPTSQLPSLEHPAPASPERHRDLPKRALLGMTFREQLQHFLQREVQPLYRLCSRPNVPQSVFDGVVASVAREYWSNNAYSDDTVLDEGLQRKIVGRVKEQLLSYKAAAESGGSVGDARGVASSIGADVSRDAFSSTEIPSVGMRPQYATPVRRHRIV